MKNDTNEMGISLPNIKMYYKVIIITLDGTGTGIVKTDQWNKRQSTEKVQKFSRRYYKLKVAF